MTMCPVTGGRLGSATYTLVNEDEALVGTVIGGRHHVREILGQGSTGTVFGTVHTHFERRSAIKVLRPRFAQLETVQRVFQGEARAAFSVSHPSLVEVFDIGTLADGTPYFAMERLEGDTLATRLARERFSTAAAVDVMMQLLAAMEAIHARDLLLRDLRPQNIFLAQRRGCRPVVKILDFGLSQLVPLDNVGVEWDALRASVTANDSPGSLSIPYYLSPERTRGEHGLEPANDLFVAASIFYEALTGQRAFSAPTFRGLLQAIAHARPTPLSVLRPDVPEALGALVMRALSASPRARPASAREMQDELRAAFEGARRPSVSVRSMPVSSTESSSQTPIRSRDRDLHPTSPASAHATDRPVGGSPEELYEDETSTDPTHEAVVEAMIAQLGAEAIDEASADHPVRTVRPPRPAPSEAGELEIDISVEHEDPATSRGADVTAVVGLAKRRHPDDEDETETMELTPEVRARIEQMTRNAAPPHPIEDSNRPPPTRRLTKPPR